MSPHSWVGKTIGGRYQIDSLLGQGGMSAVYRANDPNLRRLVAIKLIHTHLSTNPNFVHRFKEEAAAVARLRHPNIVQVHDFNTDGETYYMVMEYLIGETLQTRLKRLNATQRYMPYPEVIRYSTQLCDAVGYAHKHELIHRDIKPANVMLDVNGQAILMDFGIVKIVGGEYHTATGATIGTAMYMSPEQIRSERADERSDIYSLGVTLYEMVSGRPPYQADSALTLMMMVLNDPLPDLRDLRTNIPEDLHAVVEKALAKEPSNRYQSMEEMATALKQVQIQAESMHSVATIVDKDQPEGEVAPGSLLEESAYTKDATAEDESAELMQSKDLLVEASVPERNHAGERTPEEPLLKDMPQESAATSSESSLGKVKTTARQNVRRIVAGIAILFVVAALSVVGVFYLQSQKAPSMQLTSIDKPAESINALTAQSVVSLGKWETGVYIEDLAYSPDGVRLGTAHNRDAMRFSKYRYYGALWRLDTNSLQDYLLGHSQWVYAIAFSQDGQLIATASDDDLVILWNATDGSLAQTIEASLGGITSVDFSPNNLLLAAGSWDGRVGLWQVSNGQLLRTLQGSEYAVKSIKFSPDGKLLASASDDQSINLWQVGDGTLAHTLRGHSAPVHKLAFSPDGALLASASEDYTLGMWQISDGTLVRRLQGHSDSVFDVEFSTDGSLLASGSVDGTIRLWRVADGEILNILREHSDSVTGVAFSPDSHWLVSAASDGVLRFWGLSEAIP